MKAPPLNQRTVSHPLCLMEKDSGRPVRQAISTLRGGSSGLPSGLDRKPVKPVSSLPDCRKPTCERTVRASPAGWPVQNPQPGIPSMKLSAISAINESHDSGTLPSVGQGRPGGRAVRWRIMDSRRSQQTGSCRRRIYVLESGRRRQEKSGFRSRLQICREDTGNTAHIVLRSWVLKRTP